jgi:hypothetical protein
MAHSDHSDRTKAERIRRLKERLSRIDNPVDLVPLFKAILDLLADEL